MATPSSRRFTYDVFLSFRGEDTRYDFTGNLYKSLCDRGIHTFIDNEELQSGEKITAALVKAIEESRIAIVVLSHNYASSSFCLDELAAILDCKNKGLLVIPVFYKVDPSYVRHQKGSYGEALTKRQRRFEDTQKVQKWEAALRQVANLSGDHFKEGYTTLPIFLFFKFYWIMFYFMTLNHLKINKSLMFGTEMSTSTSLLGELLNGFPGKLIVLLYMLRITQLAYCHRCWKSRNFWMLDLMMFT